MWGDENKNSLALYYRSIFPVVDIGEWLRYIRTREFSFTLENEIYIRNITVNTVDELSARIRQDTPKKIDVGGVYVHRPASVTPDNYCLIKELVFDIDLTDYTRECCTDKEMCNRCLPLIKCAVEVLERVLASDFGFGSILFVFSGGRGVHCWVSDPVAMTLTGKDRINIVEYINRLEKKQPEEITEILMKYKKEMKLEEEISISKLYNRLFPKLDANVTKQTKHLLKLPFCVHPRTSRICVPIIREEMEKFQLEDVPTVGSLARSTEGLDKYIRYFREFIGRIR